MLRVNLGHYLITINRAPANFFLNTQMTQVVMVLWIMPRVASAAGIAGGKAPGWRKNNNTPRVASAGLKR